MKGTRFLSVEEGALARNWIVVDAKGATLGRLASQVAAIIKGKHKTTYTPHVDCGDFVVVINASEVKVTGNKATDKLYQRHSRFTGGLKTVPFRDMLAKNPERVITLAVKRMLSHGPLAHGLLTKLKVYPGASHPHAAQKPVLHKLKYGN